jgi:hypothetical protein
MRCSSWRTCHHTTSTFMVSQPGMVVLCLCAHTACTLWRSAQRRRSHATPSQRILRAGLRRHEAAVIAAVLHDVMDDAGVEVGAISAHFGAHVATMVATVSKLSGANQLLRRRRRQVSCTHRRCPPAGRSRRPSGGTTLGASVAGRLAAIIASEHLPPALASRAVAHTPFVQPQQVAAHAAAALAAQHAATPEPPVQRMRLSFLAAPLATTDGTHTDGPRGACAVRSGSTSALPRHRCAAGHHCAVATRAASAGTSPLTRSAPSCTLLPV